MQHTAETRARYRGAARARQLRRLEARGIIGSAENPYKDATLAAQWLAGFMQAYYGVAANA